MRNDILYKKLGRRSRKGRRVRLADIIARHEKYLAVEIPDDISLKTILAKNGLIVVKKNGKSFAMLPLHGNILEKIEKILEKGLGVKP